MSVYVETSAGDLVVDLFTDECPLACKNFVKLCKYARSLHISHLVPSQCLLCSLLWYCVLSASSGRGSHPQAQTLSGLLSDCCVHCRAKYYNNCLFFKITRNFIAQTGDPKNDGSGGSSVYGCVLDRFLCCVRDFFAALFHGSVHLDIIQTNSQTFRLIDGPSKRCFKGEILPELKHLGAGMLGMSSAKDNACASQFYITLAGTIDVRPLHSLALLCTCPRSSVSQKTMSN